jgi:hypothetical protein
VGIGACRNTAYWLNLTILRCRSPIRGGAAAFLLWYPGAVLGVVLAAMR